ncbi:hypothetical protein GO685_01455 [Wolbachia endosymbiont of Madathamugadia hiepei]|nr:hypothetical protein [Wolbachia endosymbiont of Madathamugadia hiepei]
MHCIALYGNKAVVETLIESGANIDAVDREKWTPLH